MSESPPSGPARDGDLRDRQGGDLLDQRDVGPSHGQAGDPPDPHDGEPRKGSSLLFRLVQIAFVATVAFFIVRYLRRAWPAVHAHEWELHPGWLLASAALIIAYYLLNGLVWWLILRGSGLPAARVPTIAVWAKSILARYLPGNVFMFVSRGWMSYRQGLDIDRVSAGMVYEQVLNVAGALVTTAALFPFWRYERDVTAWALIAIPLIVVLLHPRVFAPLAALLLRLLRRPPLQQVLPFRWVLGVLAAYAGLWLIAGLAMWTFAAAVTDVTAAAYPQLTVGFAIAFVVGLIVFFVPSGIGVREAVLAAATASVFGAGGVALAWALLVRLWQTVLELGFVAGVTLVDRATTAPDAAGESSTGATGAASAQREDR